jgi:hypothetical protein
MERTRGTVRLYRQAKALAAELGFELDEAATGGASDGNFTSALGIPTLDGMGAVGEGAHARHESIDLEHVAPRTALLAGLPGRRLAAQIASRPFAETERTGARSHWCAPTAPFVQGWLGNSAGRNSPR